VKEADIVINGINLSEGQAMTLRVACHDFYSRMSTDGLGEDDMGKVMADAYLRQAASILRIMGGGKD
jgi:hypothetical protein